MWPLCKLFLILALLTYCTAAPQNAAIAQNATAPSLDVLDELNAIMHSDSQLPSAIRILLDKIGKQETVMKSYIDDLLQKIKSECSVQTPSTTPSTTTSTTPSTTTSTTPSTTTAPARFKPADSSSFYEGKRCGTNMQCVTKQKCKSEIPTVNGTYKVSLPVASYREASGGNPCSYLQVCCHIDKITAPTASFQKDEFPVCGNRNDFGISVSLDAAPNGEGQFAEFPWVVAIMMATDAVPEVIGGGSLLAPNVVLTAAHKVDKLQVDDLVVRAGEWDLHTVQENYPHQDRTVEQVLPHEQFDLVAKVFNIALLILKESFYPAQHIAPICLPVPNQILNYQNCFVSGWGKANETMDDLPHILKKIKLGVLPTATCNNYLTQAQHFHFELDETSICAGGETGVDACIGDGGAPLVCSIAGNPNRYYQAGIVAWGVGCGLGNVPGVYTNVAYFLPWINQKLGKLAINSTYYISTN